jgi:hypothetical protein
MPGSKLSASRQFSLRRVYFALIVTVNVLLGVLVSFPLNIPWPVVLKLPGPGTFTVTVTMMACPEAIDAAVQVTVPPLPTAGAVQVPALVVKEANGNPAGNVAVNTTALAAWFCAFLICQVKVSVVAGPDVGPPFCGEPVT